MNRTGIAVKHDCIDVIAGNGIREKVRPVGKSASVGESFPGIEKAITPIEIDFQDLGTVLLEVLGQPAEKRTDRTLQEEDLAAGKFLETRQTSRCLDRIGTVSTHANDTPGNCTTFE
ncbi:hypothetical protein [Thermopetrobacter sp. TC1]|uniref:hypothetical protein n=1 Tax=Thermopetrobacter sp. TC1 TaxID=1495045 RepID=UPI001E2E0E4E|nr:hypothetical protein [Thermopetrobacter sp. TC1]